MAVIFDLDLTLVDSRIAEPFRKRRDWSGVYKLIPKFKIYDGIPELLAYLRKQGVPISVVTSSPRPYCERVLTHFGLEFDSVICYHDTSNHKPHPAPIQLAVKQLKIPRGNCYSLGDHIKDIVASRDAGTISIGCLWGTEDAEAIEKSNPEMIFETPKDGLIFFQSIYKNQ
jgi:phosphoglycolate phosphatase-like HAD superfamily hydrolase